FPARAVHPPLHEYHVKSHTPASSNQFYQGHFLSAVSRTFPGKRDTASQAFSASEGGFVSEIEGGVVYGPPNLQNCLAPPPNT
ncbi:MAG: hypothetical protein WAM09_04160, partial [Anaerolineales bacterium]